jgi:hypothetical protein
MTTAERRCVFPQRLSTGKKVYLVEGDLDGDFYGGDV